MVKCTVANTRQSTLTIGKPLSSLQADALVSRPMPVLTSHLLRHTVYVTDSNYSGLVPVRLKPKAADRPMVEPMGPKNSATQTEDLAANLEHADTAFAKQVQQSVNKAVDEVIGPALAQCRKHVEHIIAESRSPGVSTMPESSQSRTAMRGNRGGLKAIKSGAKNINTYGSWNDDDADKPALASALKNVCSDRIFAAFPSHGGSVGIASLA